LPLSRTRSRNRANSFVEMDDQIDALIDEIVVDAYGPAEQLWSFRQVFEDTARFPFAGQVAGADVEVIEIDFDGDDRHGLAAICRTAGERHSVALLDLTPISSLRSDTGALINAYRRWSNAKPLAVVDVHQQTPRPSRPVRRHTKRRRNTSFHMTSPDRLGDTKVAKVAYGLAITMNVPLLSPSGSWLAAL
jgi:hypothetical protein